MHLPKPRKLATVSPETIVNALNTNEGKIYRTAYVLGVAVNTLKAYIRLHKLEARLHWTQGNQGENI